MKALKWVGIVLVGILLIIQVIRPARTNPPIDESRTIGAHMQIPPAVAAILERSCYDCHSYKTTWPWYSQVAPVSWYLVHDVNEGRSHLNLSDWASYDAKRAAKKLEEICEEVKRGDMPLTEYLPLHPTAKLSEADRKTLCDWAGGGKQETKSGESAGADDDDRSER
jgi:hypothetical protein